MKKNHVAFFCRALLLSVIVFEVVLFNHFHSYDPSGWHVFRREPWEYVKGLLFREAHNDAAQLTKIKEYLKGKSVALVGPASSFQTMGFGTEIDSHDIVARVNSGAFTSPEFRNDYGSRIDLLFCNLNDLNVEVLAKTADLWKNAAFVVAIGTRDSDLPLLVEKFQTITFPPLYFTSRAWIKKIGDTYAKRPSTGLSSISFLLETDIKSLDVYGFDFYGSGYHRDLESVLLGSHFDRTTSARETGRSLSEAIQYWSSWHNQEEQRNFKEHLSKDPRLTWKSPSTSPGYTKE